MLDILSLIPGKKRHTTSGWHSFNGICCNHRGHSTDRRSRAGIKFTDDVNWNYHCFNCQFKCGMAVGKHFSSNLKLLLKWIGVDKDQIDKLSFESFSQRSALDLYKQNAVIKPPEFDTVELPENSRLLDSALDTEYANYLSSRGMSVKDYDFYVVDNDTRPRIIIPYYYQGRLVGHTSRFLDGRRPKYLSEQQRGYIFNIDAQQRDWEVCILVEGQFDAISIGGCAYMGSNVSDEQALLLKTLQRRIIVVPDQDSAGMHICDSAMNLGYQISIPDWGSDVKDVNDAVKKYGKFPTLMSILQNATSSKITVEMKRKKFK